MTKEIRPRIIEGSGNMTIEQWQDAIAHIRKHGWQGPELTEDNGIRSKESSGDTCTVVSKIGPLSVDEIAELFGVDTDLYEPEKITTNKWEVGMKMKNPDGTTFVVTEPLFQTKIIWKATKVVFNIEEFKESVYATFATLSLPGEITPRWGDNQLCAEVIITDHHIGKAAHHNEAWGIEGAIEEYKKAVDYYVEKFSVFSGSLGRIILPIGNDLCHIDSLGGKTSGGTQIEYTDSWLQIFRAGIACSIYAIEQFVKLADVQVIMVEGNHDRQTVLSVGEALFHRYHGDERVVVENGSSNRKYTQWGNSLIGYAHSDIISFKNIATTVMADTRLNPAYSACKNTYFRVGHLHKSAKLQGGLKLDQSREEMFGIEIEVCPSLCPTDKWHNDNGYIGNQRRSVAFIYDPKSVIQTIQYAKD